MSTIQPSNSHDLHDSRQLAKVDWAARSVCCRRMLKAGIGMMTLVTATALVVAGFCFGQYQQALHQNGQVSVEDHVHAEALFGQRFLKADGAVSSDKYSMATGFISEEAEGVFVLDHNSGLLQCNIVYPRRGIFGALYTVNVREGLGSAGKGLGGSAPRAGVGGAPPRASAGSGGYLMVTGRADFPRASNRPIASTLVYVLDTTTGNYACYAVPFDRVAVSAGRPQRGAMQLVAQGTANPVIDRDALR